MDEQGFREQALRDGFEEPVLIEWDAGTVNEEHAHDFEARVYVLSGEIMVTTAKRTCVCRAGESDGVALGEMHAERIGPEGVRFLVARKR